ncbi:hypothetical protein ACMGDK_19305 [Chryseobacterium sp. DT-3]|uniref:hypothetical protein n=1 Tax=Chryseobacterium sp. DT-3 TaxID=3396164 RepID=UPI003F1CCE96
MQFYNPATGEIITQITLANGTDTKSTIAIAHHVFERCADSNLVRTMGNTFCKTMI